MYEVQTGADAGMGMWTLLIIVGIYLYMAIAMAKTAHKIGQSQNAWWSWVPILNLLLLCKMADKPAWWAILTVLPFVNLAAWALLWVEVAKRCGKSPVWGVLMLIPLINFFVLGMFAFSDSANQISPPTPSTPAEQPRQPMNIG